MSLVFYHIMYISDINECEGPSPCDENAQCANTIGSFTCACNEGYSGDGMTCTGQNFNAENGIWKMMMLTCVCVLTSLCQYTRIMIQHAYQTPCPSPLWPLCLRHLCPLCSSHLCSLHQRHLYMLSASKSSVPFTPESSLPSAPELSVPARTAPDVATRVLLQISLSYLA